MKKLTDQELFDNAACGIISQDGNACLSNGGCAVLNKNGDRCAIGWSVTDAKPGRMSRQWYKLTRSFFGNDLRDAHDSTLLYKGFKAWQERMSNLAIIYKLDDSCVYWSKKEAK